MYMDNTAEEFGSPAPDSVEGTSEPEAEASKAPEEGNLEDEFADGGLLGALRRSKKKKEQKKELEEAEKVAANAAVTTTVQVKSKKEKEKEKKEREKAKKKAQAERKMTAPAPVEKKTGSPGPDGGDEEVKAAPAAAKAPAKKKTGKSAIAAALQKQIAARKAAEDAQRAIEEEEQRKIEEEEKRIADEERLKEEARLKKKEREKQKKEELKASGKYLTKKQKEQQAIQERRRQQLLSSGVKVEGLMGDVEKPKRVVYGKKKSKRDASEEPEEVQKEAIPAAVPAAAVLAPAEPAPTKPKVAPPPAPAAEEALIDDWEAALDSDGEVKDNWETLNEEEEEEKEKVEEQAEQAEQPKEEKSNGKAAPAAATATTTTTTTTTTTDDSNNLQRAIAKVSKRQAQINEKRDERLSKAMANASDTNLRSPICCILGHVDTGKTKLLDKVRQTNVQEGEAGGITQQIGATYFPIDAIQQKTEVMKQFVDIKYNVPGLLVIDTPGHESFTNLRSRGSSLCNIAILVVDIMHGLEPQTIESIRLLRDKKTPFVVALNKIDRLYGWEPTPNNSFRDSFAKQKLSVQSEFQDRLEKTKVAFAEQGLNSELYFQNDNLSRTVSLVPTSAITGEGVPDLLYLLLELTQSRMSKQLMYLSHLEATVLEVKVIEGLGTTIDVVLSNGILREGDRIVLCGQNGAIATNVRALLTPQPLRELRIKSAYVHNKEVKAALGVKIAAPDLEMAVAGSRLLLVGPDDDEEELMDDVLDDLTGLLNSVDKSGKGVCVQASTLGSLEALLDFLKDMKIPVMSIGIGPVFKRDVMKATTMLERAKEYAIMLCFDVKIDKEAEQYAEEQGVRIFSADIIYHLFDAFTAYQQKLLEQRKKDFLHDAIYPCILKTIQVINKRNPMIVGVDVVEGSVRVGTPISVVKTDAVTNEKQIVNLGTVISLEVNHKSTDSVRKGQTNAGVAVRLEAPSGVPPTWGRHMDESDPLYSHITRKSIDTLKDPAFRNDVPRDDWLLIKHLKPFFDIK